MMSEMTQMPDTRNHWKAQIHRKAYEIGVMTVMEAKEFAKTIEGCPIVNVPGFLHRKKWFKAVGKGQFEPINIWHDARKNESLVRSRRKADIEYSIVSLLQNAGNLSSSEIHQRLWLNSSREVPLTVITNCCNLSTHISGSPERWSVK